MTDSTRKRSRSDKERRKSDSKNGKQQVSQGISNRDTNDPAVDITLRGTYTIDGRRVMRKLKKLKWPAILIGICVALVFGPRVADLPDLPVSPGFSAPVEIPHQ